MKIDHEKLQEYGKFLLALKMHPYFDIAHYILMCLVVREDIHLFQTCMFNITTTKWMTVNPCLLFTFDWVKKKSRKKKICYSENAFNFSKCMDLQTRIYSSYSFFLFSFCYFYFLFVYPLNLNHQNSNS